MRRTLLALLLLPIGLLAQAPAAPPAPTALVVGSGNFFSPIVASLERSLAFYREGLGLQATGEPSTAENNAPLRDMFGLPEAHLRWTIARVGSARSGVEIAEVTGAGGRPLNRGIQDPGAFTLLATVADAAATMQRLVSHGGTVVTADRAPMTVGSTTRLRAVVVRDPDDHFIELLQPDPLPDGTAFAGVLETRIRVTVDNLDRAVALYRDALGLRQVSIKPFAKDPTGMRLLGVPNGEYRYASLQVPDSNLSIELIEFRGMKRTRVQGRLQDPGSTRLQLQVRDLDAATRAIAAAGGAVVSTGAKAVELPAGRGAPLRAAIVRDPDNLFLVLIERR